MKKSKKQKNKLIIILSVITMVLFLIVFIVLVLNFRATGKTVQSQVEIVPLNQEEKGLVMNVLSSSEMVSDIPEKAGVQLRFFKFENGQRVWQDGFNLGKGDLDVYLSIDSKYIGELKNKDLCDVIKEANRNGDVGFYSEKNQASLLWKYKGMLKYRECFGF